MIEKLPRREREVFETLCALGSGSAASIRAAMGDPPSDSATRTLLGRLSAKGLVTHRTVAQAYIYAPTEQTEAIAAGALHRLVDTFFAGSAVRAATALLGLSNGLDPDEAAILQRAIDKARQESGK